MIGYPAAWTYAFRSYLVNNEDDSSPAEDFSGSSLAAIIGSRSSHSMDSRSDCAMIDSTLIIGIASLFAPPLGGNSDFVRRAVGNVDACRVPITSVCR